MTTSTTRRAVESTSRKNACKVKCTSSEALFMVVGLATYSQKCIYMKLERSLAIEYQNLTLMVAPWKNRLVIAMFACLPWATTKIVPACIHHVEHAFLRRFLRLPEYHILFHRRLHSTPSSSYLVHQRRRRPWIPTSTRTTWSSPTMRRTRLASASEAWRPSSKTLWHYV